MKRAIQTIVVLFIVAGVLVVIARMVLQPESRPALMRRASPPRFGGNGRGTGIPAATAGVAFPPESMSPIPEAERPTATPFEEPGAGRPEGRVNLGPDMRAPAAPQWEVEAPASAEERQETAADGLEHTAESMAPMPETQAEDQTPQWEDAPTPREEGRPTPAEVYAPAPQPAATQEAGTEMESDESRALDEGERGDQRDIVTAAFDAAMLERAPEMSFPDALEEALRDAPPAPVTSRESRTAESYLDEGNVYFNVGQYRLAIERYTSAIALSDRLVAAYYNRANAHTRNSDYDDALADYNRALELQPDDADALNNRGMLHLYRSNYEAALDDFDAALTLDPSDTTVMVNRGLAHLHGGDPANALVDFQEAASLDSEDAAAHYGAAQASAVLHNRDSALRHLRKALELDAAYAREAAADPKLELLQGNEQFLRLLRESGTRTGR
jgi:tetratricopeptide (TPR) repeat protein